MASRKVWLARNVEDVNVSGVGDGDSLVWDAGTSKWIPGAGGVGAGIDTVQENGSEKIDDADTLNLIDSGGVTITVTDEGSGLAQVTISGVNILDELADVAITSPTTEQVLYYNTASGWQNIDLPLEYLANVQITDPQESQFLQYNSTTGTWVNHSALVANALYLHDDISDIPGYYELQSSPPNSAEVIDGVNVAAASGIMLIEQYITDVELGTTLLPGGTWHFSVWAKVDNTSANSYIITNVYLRTSGGVETLVNSTQSADINSTSLVQQENDTYIPDILCNKDDRLVIKYYASTTSVSSRVISFAHDGSDHYTHVHLPFTVGGTSGTPTALDDLSDVTAPSPSDGDVLTYDSGEWINSPASGGGHTIVWSGGALPQRTNLRFTPGLHTARNFGTGTPDSTQNWVDVRDDPDTDTTWVSVSGSFLGLTDTPLDYAANTGEFVQVNGNGDGLTFAAINPATTVYQEYTVASGTSAFTMTYTPVSETAMQVFWNGVAQQHDHFSYTSTTLYTDFVVNVGDEFWITYLRQGTYVDITEDFLALSDTPNSYSSQAGKVVVVNPGETALEFVAPTSVGSTTFLGLSDTPDAYTNFDQAIVMVSGTNLNYLRGNELGFPIADLRRLTNVHSRDCEFINQPAFSGWSWQATAGTTMTLSTCSGWMHHTSTTEGLYNYGLDLPSHLVALPAVGNTAKFFTTWLPAHKGNWAVAMKASLNNGRHSGDSVQLTVSTFLPAAASIEPTHGVTVKIKDNGVNYDVQTYYYNGAGQTGALVTTTSYVTSVYLALASMSDGMIHVYYSTDGLGWNWLGWHNASTVWSTQGIGCVWIGFNDATGATSTVSTGIVDWIRFLEGSVNLWELTRGR